MEVRKFLKILLPILKMVSYRGEVEIKERPGSAGALIIPASHFWPHRSIYSVGPYKLIFSPSRIERHSEETCRKIILHELAHWKTSEERRRRGEPVVGRSHHGQEWKKWCKVFAGEPLPVSLKAHITIHKNAQGETISEEIRIEEIWE